MAEPGTRDRLVAVGAELMRRNGYAGTGIKSILAASGSAYGSLYHHFPGGKEQLGAEVLRQGGQAYRELVEAFYRRDADLIDATSTFFEEAADFVESTGYVDACPIGTIAGEIASTSETMREAAAEAFTSWTDVVEARLVGAGVGVERAHEVAVELFCAIEGGFLLARVVRDVTPIRIAGRGATDVVRRAVSESHAPEMQATLAVAGTTARPRGSS